MCEAVFYTCGQSGWCSCWTQWWHFCHDCLEPDVFLSPLNLWQKPILNQNLHFFAFVLIRWLWYLEAIKPELAKGGISFILEIMMFWFFFSCRSYDPKTSRFFPKDIYCELNVFLISHPQLSKSTDQMMLTGSYLESWNGRFKSLDPGSIWTLRWC